MGALYLSYDTEEVPPTLSRFGGGYYRFWEAGLCSMVDNGATKEPLSSLDYF